MPGKLRRLRPEEIAADAVVLDAVSEFETYEPTKPENSLDTVRNLRDTMYQLQQEEDRIERLLKATRSRARQGEVNYHDSVLALKQQVIAQYGDDSEEVKAIGLTRKSERKRPVRRGAVALK